MNRSERDQLLKEVLGTDELADLREQSLQHGLQAVHRRRKQRVMLRTGSIVILAVFCFLYFRSNQPPVVTSNQNPITDTATIDKIGDIKLITDEELFALFPGRSVALIGKPGHQQLVFLNTQTQASTDQKAQQEKPF
jgi:hypothetical protein